MNITDQGVDDPPASSDRTVGPATSTTLTFDALYRDAYEPMLRLAALLVDTVGEAEHVVQDAFMAVYKRYDTIREPRAYLRVTVVNGCRKTLRRRRLVRRRPAEREQLDEIEFNHVIDEIKRLPVEQRVLVGLRYDQQMTDREIAEEMGIPIGTVKSRLHRAITTLRQEIR